MRYLRQHVESVIICYAKRFSVSYFRVNFSELLNFDFAIVYLLEKLNLKSSRTWRAIEETEIGFIEGYALHRVIRNSKLAADKFI